MTLANDFHDLREEILERVWVLCEESGKATLAGLGDVADAEAVRDEVEHLAKQGLLALSGEAVALTDKGTGVARHVVRANGLAARLLVDLFEMSATAADAQACRLEHAISPEVADGLCTLLGHPPSAPNGRQIPRGACCEVLRAKTGSVVRPLTELELGHSGRLTFIHTRYPERLDQLATLGLVPGTEVRLKQRHPAVVVEADQTTLALDAEVAREIFVKPVD